MASHDCPKCQGRMAEGFILDMGNAGYGTAQVSKWQEGGPKKSFWTGLKLDKAHQLPVTTWRCESCGYLESYAAAE